MTYDQGELTEVVQSMCSKKEAPKNIFAKKNIKNGNKKTKGPRANQKQQLSTAERSKILQIGRAGKRFERNGPQIRESKCCSRLTQFMERDC